MMDPMDQLAIEVKMLNELLNGDRQPDQNTWVIITAIRMKAVKKLLDNLLSDN